MNREQLIRELRKYARDNDLSFEVDTRRGKGSHYLVSLGDRTTTIQSDINEGRAKRIRKQLGVAD